MIEELAAHRAVRWQIWAWLALGVVCFAAHVTLHDRAFPEADVPIELDRQAAISRAEELLAELGHDVKTYRRSASFECNYQTKEFLEKELPVDEANRLMHKEVVTWYWFVRFVVPGQEEEFQISLWPDGRLAYFYHHLPEAARGQSITRDLALEIAEAFLRGRPHIDFDRFSLKSDTQQSRPNRVDHFFKWEHTEFDVSDSNYLVSVHVSGNEISYFSEGLEIPEKWLRSSEKIAAHRNLLAQVARFASQLFGLASLFMLLLLIRSGDARYRAALWLGVITTGLHVLQWLNALPTFWLGYSTADSVADYLGTQLISLASTLFVSPLLIVIALVPAEGLARRVFPQHIEVSRCLTKAFWQSQPVVTAVFVGLSLAFFHAAFIEILYLAARPLGVWCPQSTPYEGALDSAMPWLRALSTGFSPALSEEVFNRMFVIAFVYWLTKRAWLAILVSATIWGFSHTLYPQEPIYFRGVELTLVGIVYGFVFVRFGVIATFVSHYTYNALVSGWFLFNSGITSLQFSGAIVIGLAVVPALPGVWSWLRGLPLPSASEVNALPYGSIRDDGEVVSRSPDPEPALFVEYKPVQLLRSRSLAILVLLGLLGIAAHWSASGATYFGDWMRVSVTREEAIAKANDFLTERGIDTTAYRTVGVLVNDLNTQGADYVWQQVGEAELNRIWQERFKDDLRWSVRFFQPLNPEQYWVFVSTIDKGRIIDYWHSLPDDAPGASLGKEEAQTLAEQHLRASRGYTLDSYTLLDTSMEDRKNRRDHWFVWEDSAFTVGEAKFRVSVRVIGDEVCYATPFIYVPDAWARARTERTTRDLVKLGMATVLGLIALGIGVATVVVLARNHLFRFRTPALCALAGVVVAVLWALNNLPWFWADYSTTSPPGVYIGQQVMSALVVEPVTQYVVFFMAFVFSSALYRYVFPREIPLLAWLGVERLGNSSQTHKARLRAAWGDALIAGFGVSGIMLGVLAIEQSFSLDFGFTSEARNIDSSAPIATAPGEFSVAVPLLDFVADAITYLPLVLLLVTILGSVYVRWIRQYRWLCVWVSGLFLLGNLPSVASADDLQSALASFAIVMLVAVPAIFLFVSKVARNNMGISIAIVLMSVFMPTSADFLRDQTQFGFGNAVASYCVTGLLLALGIWLRVRYREGSHVSTEASSIP